MLEKCVQREWWRGFLHYSASDEIYASLIPYFSSHRLLEWKIIKSLVALFCVRVQVPIPHSDMDYIVFGVVGVSILNCAIRTLWTCIYLYWGPKCAQTFDCSECELFFAFRIGFKLRGATLRRYIQSDFSSNEQKLEQKTNRGIESNILYCMFLKLNRDSNDKWDHLDCYTVSTFILSVPFQLPFSFQYLTSSNVRAWVRVCIAVANIQLKSYFTKKNKTIHFWKGSFIFNICIFIACNIWNDWKKNSNTHT